MLEQIEQFCRRARDQQHVPVLPPQETLRYRVVEKLQEVVEVAADIQETARLRMKLQLTPGQHFDDLLQRPESAWHSDKPVGQDRHQRFSFMHGIDDVQFGQVRVCNFLFLQGLGDNATDFAAILEDRVGENTHQTFACTPIDEIHPGGHQQTSQLPGSSDIYFVCARAGPAIHANPLH
jgi:hypothetical protein